MDGFNELHEEIDFLIQKINKRNLLDLANIKTDEFLQLINNSSYLITIHDVQLYRPIYINDKMKEFYGFSRNKLKNIDYIFYLKTMHASTYATLIDSVSFFRNQKEEYLDLTYKLSYKKKEWRIVNGSTKTIIKDEKSKDKYAITLAKENRKRLTDEPKNVYMDLLTNRERLISEFLTKGFSRKEIAEELSISEHTVHSHIKNSYKKLGINKVSELIHIVKKYVV